MKGRRGRILGGCVTQRVALGWYITAPLALLNCLQNSRVCISFSLPIQQPLLFLWELTLAAYCLGDLRLTKHADKIVKILESSPDIPQVPDEIKECVACY